MTILTIIMAVWCMWTEWQFRRANRIFADAINHHTRQIGGLRRGRR